MAILRCNTVNRIADYIKSSTAICQLRRWSQLSVDFDATSNLSRTSVERQSSRVEWESASSRSRTGCRRAAATACPALCGRRAHRNVAVVSHAQYVPNFPRSPLQLPDALRPRWVKRPGDLDLWPFDLESGVRVTCDMGYLCANFSLPRPVCSRLRPDVRDIRQTDRRQTKASLNAPAY